MFCYFCRKSKKTNPFASAEGCTNFCPPKNKTVPQNFSQGDKLSANDGDDDDDDDDDRLTVMKWLKVLPWKGSRSWCQQKIPCRTVAMLSADVFFACLDK